MSRRQFLKASGSAAGLMVMGWAFPEWARADVSGSPIFVELQLLGGMDQFNLIHPRGGLEFDALSKKRSVATRLDPASVIPLSANDKIGVHPYLATPLINAGAWSSMRVLQHADFSPFLRNRSHRERQRSAILGLPANSNQNVGTLGRLHSAGVPLVMFSSVVEDANLTCEGRLGCPARPLQLDSLETFNLESAEFLWNEGGADNAKAVANTIAELSNMQPDRPMSALEIKYRQEVRSMFNSVGDVQSMLTHKSPKYAEYAVTTPAVGHAAFYNSVAAKLRGVATIISHRKATGFTGPMVFTIGIGEFDTHADWKARNDELMFALGNSLGTFIKDLKAMGVWNNTVVSTVTEFGRRLYENGTGTDHGEGSAVFMLGGKVKPGIFGAPLTATEINTLEDLPFRYDMRGMMAQIFQRHLGVSPSVAYPNGVLSTIADLNTNFDLFV